MAVICKIPRRPIIQYYFWKQYYLWINTKYYYDVKIVTYYLQPDNPQADADGYIFGFEEEYIYQEYDEEQTSRIDYGNDTKTEYNFEYIETKQVEVMGPETGTIVKSPDPTAYPSSGFADDGYWYELIIN